MKSPSRRILITGAGSGLGRGLACALAAQGHTIVATDLRLETVQETASLAGAGVEAHALDVTREEEVARLARELSGPPIEVLINNAGLQHVAKVEEFPTAAWDTLAGVMLRGPFLLCRAFLPGMRAAGFGRLIHIGSIHSLVASAGKSAYTAAKHALLGFSKVLALETADTEITSNTICPAYVRTPLVEGQIQAQAKLRGISEDDVIQKIMLEPMPKGAFVTYEEVAAAVEYLMSPMARNVTGQTITIDGGWTAR